MNKKYYYDIADDLETYPDAWCILAIGGRNTGKTYSTLKKAMNEGIKIVFLKRNIDDVDLLCSGSGQIGSKQNEYGFDLSPYKSINRDLGTDVKAYSIKKGLGGFWKHLNGEPSGEPIGYLMALNAVSKYKGFDLSDCEWLVFDEFIPNIYDRINRNEGEQLMDLYKTISRDREHRGLPPLKLICLANATSISNQTMNILEVTDRVANMIVSGEEYSFDSERGILIHIIEDNEEFLKKEKESPIYKAMGHTAWGQMSFDNEFAYNDFSNIGRTSLKGYRPACSICYKTFNWYIYQKDGGFYMTNSRHNGDEIYNLNRENDQKLFFSDWFFVLREACINNQMLFESYSMYDLLANYKKYFKV